VALREVEMPLFRSYNLYQPERDPVQHNLDKYPTVVVVDTTGREIIAEITHESTDQMVIRLNPAASGKIIYS